MATLSQNINQAISDFNSIKTAIENKHINIPSGTPTSQYSSLISQINDMAYYKSLINGSISTAIIPDDVTTLKAYAFSHCTQLTSVFIPATVTRLDGSNFEGCTNITNAVVSHGVTFMGSRCFWNCYSLLSISLPNTLTTFGFQSMRYCSALTNVTLESNWNCGSADFSWSPNITVESLVGMLNSLKDLTGTTAKTLTVGATNTAKLTAEQIAIATNKNWNLA